MLARRRALSAPAVRPARSDLLGVSQAPPPLYIPSVPRSVITPPVDAPPPATSAPPAPEVHPAQAPSPVPALPPPSYDLPDRKSTRLHSSHSCASRMTSSA